MGIKGLSKFISDNAPRAVRQRDFDFLSNRVVAIDASMSLYQFIIAIRDDQTFGTLTNDKGETTSHLSGFLTRVVRLLEHNIQPVYVFDGVPPTLKGGELAKRSERRHQAEADLRDAQEKGDQEEIKKYVGRTVRVTKDQNEDAKRLLRLMGCPVVDAPCEAEAQCAQLCKDGLAYATATEDADALTFGTPILVRHLNFSEKKTGPKELPLLLFDLPVALADLELTMDEFIDFCILCGCDYTDSIKNVGPTTAYKLIKTHRNIETILQNLDERHVIPPSFPFDEARQFFQAPVVDRPTEKFQWKAPDYDGIRTFLIDENQFGVQRVDNVIIRLKKLKASGQQQRLDSFFKPKPKTETEASVPKRPLVTPAAKGNAKKRARK